MKPTTKSINKHIRAWKEIKDKLPHQLPDFDENQISDGYHTFDELYEFRKMYNAAFANSFYKETSHHYAPSVYKSWRHSDGELCFGGGWFIVVIILPTGQISNHYKTDEWDLFQIPEVEFPLDQFDGHTPQDVLKRLEDYLALPR